MSESKAAAAPVGAAERVTEMDVLRGVALFGVFLVNMVSTGGAGFVATDAQLAALPTAAIDQTATFLMEWLISDKANTLFAFLFGLGFYIQMERATAKGAAFERIYLRRLFVLLCFGIAHTLFLWVFDILHLYALAGFLLFFLRKLPTRALLIAGLALIAVGDEVQNLVFKAFGGGIDTRIYSDAAVLERQAAALSGDYWSVFASFWGYTWGEWLAGGMIFGWILYALGRFLMGAWVGRQGWLQNARANLPGFRKVMWIAVPAGLAIAFLGRGLEKELFAPWLGDADVFRTAGQLLRPLAAATLAAGYLCAIVLALHTKLGSRLLSPFRHVGRMALTNYVSQSFAYGFVLTSIGPGLGLSGKIGATGLMLISVAGFALQALFSRWWLARFQFGPLEWAWRGLTYGSWPKFRRTAAEGAAA